MDRNEEIPRIAVGALIIVPLALLVGLALSNPLSQAALGLVGIILLGLCLPLLIAHHQMLLIGVWNTTLIAFFLPGQPHLATAVACGSLALTIFTTSIRRGQVSIRPRSLILPLALLVGIIVVTGALNGVGGRVLGTEQWGLRNYVYLFGAVVGFLALTARPLPREQAWLAAMLFVGGGMTTVISDFAAAAGPHFFFLFAFFHSEFAMHQVTTQDSMLRLAGVGNAGMAATALLFLRYGVNGLLEWRRPWRLATFLVCIAISLLGGFRSTVVLLGLTFLTYFYMEKLHRTVLLPVLVGVGLVGGVLVVNFAEELPLSAQRCISFLPIRLHPEVEFNARHSLEWRLDMWRRVMHELPQHFWTGKGFSFNATDYLMATEAMRRGEAESYEGAFISGDFHNGVLTTLLPLGIFGLLAFTWFGVAALRVLINNHRWGDPDLALINRFLLATFLVRFCYFFTFYGSFSRDLAFFCGYVGLSLAINGGVQVSPASALVQPEPKPTGN
jgi:O-antigen ligase